MFDGVSHSPDINTNTNVYIDDLYSEIVITVFIVYSALPRWHYSPMRTLASFMDFTHSAFLLHYIYIYMCVCVCVCVFMYTYIYIYIYNRTIILPVVLYGCETWSLTLREKRRLRVFENRALRRIFGPKRDEVTGKWRNLHN